MEWYIPITILPGVGMLILSTTSQMMALSGEIGALLKNKCTPFQHQISDRKIKQLTRLSSSAALLYISAACFVLSGIAGSVVQEEFGNTLPKVILILGVVLVLIALFVLIVYGLRAIGIRKIQHQHNHDMA